MPDASPDSEYVARLKLLYSYFNAHDMDGILSLFSDAVVWNSYAPDFAKALGEYTGKNTEIGIQRFFADLAYQQADQLFEPQFFYGDGPIVNASGIENGWWNNGMWFTNHWNHTIWFDEGTKLAYQFRANYNLALSGPPTHAAFPPTAEGGKDAEGNAVVAPRPFPHGFF